MYMTNWQMIDDKPRRCASLSSGALSQILTRIVRDGDNLGMAPLASLEAECDFRERLNLSSAILATDYMEEFRTICADIRNSDAYKRNYGEVYDEYMKWRRKTWNEADGFIPLASPEEDEGMLIPFNLGDYPGSADAIFGENMRKCRKCLQKLHFPEYGVVIDHDLLPEKIEDGGSFGLPLALAFSHTCIFPHSGDNGEEQAVKHPLFIATGELSLDEGDEVVFKAVGGIDRKMKAARTVGASFVCVDNGVKKGARLEETKTIVIPDNTIFVQAWTFILNNLNGGIPQYDNKVTFPVIFQNTPETSIKNDITCKRSLTTLEEVKTSFELQDYIAAYQTGDMLKWLCAIGRKDLAKRLMQHNLPKSGDFSPYDAHLICDVFFAHWTDLPDELEYSLDNYDKQAVEDKFIPQKDVDLAMRKLSSVSSRPLSICSFTIGHSYLIVFKNENDGTKDYCPITKWDLARLIAENPPEKLGDAINRFLIKIPLCPPDCDLRYCCEELAEHIATTAMYQYTLKGYYINYGNQKKKLTLTIYFSDKKQNEVRRRDMETYPQYTFSHEQLESLRGLTREEIGSKIMKWLDQGPIIQPSVHED